ncbi:hypothetical protein SNE40_007127 [Patella caerulea]|uniref:DUF4708 domain-containing protein n=1 Tax=Patella caerulea TaxID=87958 RepID=A0AAN8JZ12_PATCE
MNRTIPNKRHIHYHVSLTSSGVEPDIIASPALDFDQCFYVIMQKKMYMTGKLQGRFERKGAKVSDPYRVLPSLYQTCLIYTLTAKIAPMWNKVGDWLLHGRDFLTHNGYTNAIKMNLIVNSKELYMSLTGTSMRCPHVQIDDLDASSEYLGKMFQGHPHFEILELDQWCYILPSMKKGRIVSVSRNIPQYDCPFQTYRDLKKHWKNTYGYRLPETDDDLLYYQVSFLPLGGRLFTYPSICIRSRNLQSMPRVDPKPVIATFLLDVHSKISQICGHPFKFQPKIRYTEQQLLTCSEEEPDIKPNLTCRKMNPTTCPLRHISSLQHMYKSHPLNQLIIKNSQSQTQRMLNLTSKSDTASMKPSSSSIPEEKNLPPSPECPVFNGNTVSSLSFNSESEDKNTSASYDIEKAQPEKTSRIIPLFRPKNKSFNLANKSNVPKTVPSFAAKPRPQIPERIVHQSSSSQNIPNSVESYTVPDNRLPKTLPIFTSKIQKAKQNSLNIPPLGTPKTPSFPSKKQIATQKQSTPKLQKKVMTQKPPSTPKDLFTTSESIEISFNIYNNGPPGNSSKASTPKATPSVTHKLKTPDLPTHSFSKFTNNKLMKTPDGTANKRKEIKTPCSEGESEAKKPRAKPKLQDVDVEKLARSNQLNKVNALTLTTWLKQRNVVCKGKDKKGDLVDKVFIFLNLAKPVELQTLMQCPEA